jgi:hypothetical protein
MLPSHAPQSTRLAAVLFDADLQSASPLLNNVRVLATKESVLPPMGKKDAEPTPSQWLELFQPFSRASEVRDNFEQLVPDVVHALTSTRTWLQGYCLAKPDFALPEGLSQILSAMGAAERFVAMRGLPGR